MTATLERTAIECEQLRISPTVSDHSTVDREAKIIRGFVVAQLGPFRTAGRGEFDDRSLKHIRRLMLSMPDGLPSYYGHPTKENPEQLGKFLGRARDPRIEAITITRNGEKKEVQAVLADMHLSPTAFESNPNGNIGGYVMELAASDPKAFATSLVLEAAKEHRLSRGRPVVDEQGNPLPPLWRPLALGSIDVVQIGEAVDSFLPSRLSADMAMEMLSAGPMDDEEDSEIEDDEDLSLRIKVWRAMEE